MTLHTQNCICINNSNANCTNRYLGRLLNEYVIIGTLLYLICCDARINNFLYIMFIT